VSSQNNGFKRLGAFIVVFVLISPLTATTIRRVKVEDLFREADLVATVRILSGDTEHYGMTVYRANVLSAMKGTVSGAKIYFGPSESYGVGDKYLVFLRRSPKAVEPTGASGLNYGRIPAFYEIMYAGFSIMQIEYTCVFEAGCDSGTRLNPEQIILPKKIKPYPAGEADARTNYQKWVYTEILTHYLENEDALKPQ